RDRRATAPSCAPPRHQGFARVLPATACGRVKLLVPRRRVIDEPPPQAAHRRATKVSLEFFPRRRAVAS
ncbi:hypothetical protein PFISCL1PPCAC_4463, partial [Pristionchus fissidentatus]